MLLVRWANDTDLPKILSLQQQNTKSFLSKKEQEEQGFVTLEHSKEELQKMQALSPQIIADDAGKLAAYALVMPQELRTVIPVLIPLFELLESLHYNGIPVNDLSYYVMGQVCIEKSYRGKGLLNELYAAHREKLSPQYDYCITEISTRNLRSIRAHEKVGFELLHTFTDATDQWNIVIWDWTK